MNRRVDFFISNNNHHFQMMRLIIKQLKENGHEEVRMLSLCEFRRMLTPKEQLESESIPYEILASLKIKGTATSTGKKGIGGNQSPVRNILRKVIWLLKLKPALKHVYESSSALVVVPNDVAYPFSYICPWLRKKNIPFVLMQEGIRFPLPNEQGQEKYGTNGARKLFAWGNRSVSYFKNIGVENAIPTGNPRIDIMYKLDYTNDMEQIRKEYSISQRNILYLSNPIDDQGYCTHEEKLGLFKMFLTSLFTLPNIQILVRLHPREDINDFKALLEDDRIRGRTTFIQEPPIAAVLQIADKAVVLASTAGLEALLFETPIGVIKLPNHGYIFDYVDAGVATPIDSSTQEKFNSSIIKLLDSPLQESVKDYIQDSFAHLGVSSSVIVSEIEDLLNA